MGVPTHALLLTAGLGTRLLPLTQVRAKPAIPVAGIPLVRRVVSWLAGSGVSDLVANLHHLPATLTSVLGDGSDLGVRVRYSWEQPVVLGSAGGPRQALPIIGAETFLVVNGDTLTDVDLVELAAFHESSGGLVTLALVPNREPMRYGGVHVGERGAVTGFAGRGPAAIGSGHFVGVQIVDAGIFRPLAAGFPASSIGGVYDDVIARRPGAIRAFVSDAAFWDIGTVADYWRTSMAFSDGAGRDRHSILWDDVEIPQGASVDSCIVTDGVSVPAGSVFGNSILLRTETGGVRAVPFDLPEDA
jgi:NDP-sugar pyrophosphorylase family protein